VVVEKIKSEKTCLIIVGQTDTQIYGCEVAFASAGILWVWDFMGLGLAGKLGWARLTEKSALADGGPRSLVCTRETLRLAPH
jgi:hypothetical protein